MLCYVDYLELSIVVNYHKVKCFIVIYSHIRNCKVFLILMLFFFKKITSQSLFTKLTIFISVGNKTTRLTIMVTTIYYEVEKQKICASSMSHLQMKNNDVEPLTFYEM